MGGGRELARALHEAAPEASVRGAGFRGIFLVEAPGDALELAERVSHAAGARIGRAMALLAEVASERQPIEEAAVTIARRHVGRDETFCFRLHKRGAHGLVEASQALEGEIGGAIWTALRDRDGRDPKVELASPDVTVSAELLGPRTVVCLRRRAWRPPG
jgi:tRNA(Ser,Leu) C12 N-acetylase TAN1